MDYKELAETIDRLKIFPRIVILGYAGYGIYYIEWTTREYFKLNAPDWNETSFTAVTIAAILIFLAKISIKFMET